MDQKSFDTGRIAAGYAKDRPYLHPQVIEQIKKELHLSQQLENGADVGCGAGLSARALKALCRQVTGTDISPAMIQAARQMCPEENYHFAVCRAEELTAKDSYDIVTASGMIQWVEQEAFLKNLSRCIKSGGYLVCYDFWITDKMADPKQENCADQPGNQAYFDWWNQVYLPKFPKPCRRENVWTEKETEPFGFGLHTQKELCLEWRFSLDTFVRFMMIQSNVNEKLADGQVTEEEARQWFFKTLSPIFAGQEKTLLFTGYIWYLQRR